ncbi:MAG: alpha/beta fold hydrolase [Rikenella sp.]|nr:alpha/beta fold hydrolase [Rikenella sp.]
MEFTHTTLHFPDDYDGPVVATLIRASLPPAGLDTGRAVLYVHGYVDYFFQTHMAEAFVARGYRFYAVELRKYGRSMLEGQHPNFARSMYEYYPDLTESIRRIVAEGATEVVLLGHSTGGLLAALYADWLLYTYDAADE